jgi:HD-GYP domain-containing protein (c-di-GMP phosphodiesterase class II)
MITSEMTLAKTIYKGRQVYLTAGQGNITKYKDNLRRIGIEYIYVDDEISKGIEIPDVVSDETRIKCRVALQDTIERFAETSILDISEVEPGLDTMLEEIVINEDVKLSLNDISIVDDYTFSHSVSVTVYGALLARKLGFNQEDIHKLATGLLLHDVGKTMLDPDILFKQGKLEEEEFEYVKSHTTLGYEALSRCFSLTESSRIISLSHHERLNGSGYPRGISGEKLSPFVRIAGIADVYDALTSDRCYRPKWPASKAVDYLISRCGTEFDTDMVSTFVKQIAVYPNGSLVKLANGFIAIVVSQNASAPLRPRIRVITDPEGKMIEPFEVDLMDELSIVITESQLELNKSINQ